MKSQNKQKLNHLEILANWKYEYPGGSQIRPIVSVILGLTPEGRRSGLGVDNRTILLSEGERQGSNVVNSSVHMSKAPKKFVKLFYLNKTLLDKWSPLTSSKKIIPVWLSITHFFVLCFVVFMEEELYKSSSIRSYRNGSAYTFLGNVYDGSSWLAWFSNPALSLPQQSNEWNFSSSS